MPCRTMSEYTIPISVRFRCQAGLSHYRVYPTEHNLAILNIYNINVYRLHTYMKKARLA